ncbi:MAG TPA: alpha/beta hydrolase [Rhizomicrobium sp.]|jgi:acetyl esterase/lipase|nr:alpha/beta hydrolase [Rhizomicrobium sp.]
MHKLGACLSAALLIFAAPAKAQAPGAIAPAAIFADPYPAHAVKFPGGVIGMPDMVFAGYTGYRPLTLDLYLPLARPKPIPLVVFIHGGSLKSANARFAIGIPDFPSRLAALAARGYVVASVNYRLRDEARFPAQVRDVKAAIIFLRANAARYNIDPSRAVVWGGSSGGQLAVLVAMTCGKAEFAPRPSSSRPMLPEVAAANEMHVSDCVQGAVSWYGDLALSQEAGDPDIAAFLGCNPCGPADIASADPMTFASAAAPPLLIIQGMDTASVLLTEARAMAARLVELKAPVETLYIPDVGHGFVGKTSQVTRDANDKALARTFDYIDKVFAGSSLYSTTK